MGEPLGWFELVYRVPREPSRLLATVRRRLRSLRTVFLHNAVGAAAGLTGGAARVTAAAPGHPDVDGGAQLLSASALAGQSDVVAAFDATQDEGAVEVIDHCRHFLTEVAFPFVVTRSGRHGAAAS